MKISILGTEYTITKLPYDADPSFKERSIDGYCDHTKRKIVTCDLTTHPGWKNESKESCSISEQETLRHEIIHAFLDEAGLQDNCLNYQGAWSLNEEMVDWFALIGPKICRAWNEAGAFPQKI